jgi:hypothetical protein
MDKLGFYKAQEFPENNGHRLVEKQPYKDKK